MLSGHGWTDIKIFYTDMKYYLYSSFSSVRIPNLIINLMVICTRAYAEEKF